MKPGNEQTLPQLSLENPSSLFYVFKEKIKVKNDALL